MSPAASSLVGATGVDRVPSAAESAVAEASDTAFQQVFARVEKRSRQTAGKGRHEAPATADDGEEDRRASDAPVDNKQAAPAPQIELVAALMVPPSATQVHEPPVELLPTGRIPDTQAMIASTSEAIVSVPRKVALPASDALLRSPTPLHLSSAPHAEAADSANTGTNSAQYAAQMKKSAKTGQGEQTLPGAALPSDMDVAGTEEVPHAPQSWSRETAFERATTPVTLAGVYGRDTIAPEVEAAPALAEVPTRAVETQIEQTVVRFRAGGLDSLIVTVRPDNETEIRLSIAQDGDAILIAAKLERGEFDLLNERWPALQRELQQRGVILGRIESPDANVAMSTSEHSPNNAAMGQGFHRFHEPEDSDPAAEAQLRDGLQRRRTSAMALTSLPVEPRQRAYFESWA